MSRRGLARALAGAGALLCLAMPAAAGAATLPAGFEEDVLVEGLTRPTSVAWTPDGRMLIAEKDGVLKQVLPGSSVAQSILNLSVDVNSSNDRGLLGLAVDSDFASNRYVYLLYTYEPDNYVMLDSEEPAVSRLTRIVLGDDGSVSQATTLLGSHGTAPCPLPAGNVDCIPSDGSTHSIGTVQSAPDGSLFVGSGDAAGFARREQDAFRTYDPNSMAGKILRIDRNGQGWATNTTCADPVTSVCRKIYAGGFRNPFRFTLMPGASGKLAVGDVGWFTTEEVSIVAGPGRSYGWPCYEGSERTTDYQYDQKCIDLYAAEDAGTRPREVAPFHEYPHLAMSSSAMAGPVYQGSSYPLEHRGSLFFYDYGAGFIKYFKRNASGDPVGGPLDFADGWLGVEVDTHPDNGDLVYVTPGDFQDGSGSIVRISYSPQNRKPIAVASATPAFGAAPLAVSFSAAGSSDPDGDPLTYSWHFGDGSATGTGASTQHTYQQGGTYYATLTVDDGGRTATKTLRIDVDNFPPVPTISLPVDESTYRVGGTVQLEGSATDDEDAAPPELKWTLRLVHGSHLHTGPVVTTPTGSFTTATDHDADSHYEVTLTATDSKKLSASKTVQVRPETVGFGIRSEPPGAPVSYAGLSLFAPASFPAAVDFTTTVAAAQSFVRNGTTYTFRSWSNSGARLQTVSVPPGGLELIAAYDGPAGSGGAASPEADSPQLRFDRVRGLVARRGLVRGVAVDANGIRRVDAALALRAGSRCRWWVAAQRRPSKPLSCKRPRWLRAKLGKQSGARRSWQLRMGRRTPAGRWLVKVRATDRTGAVATATFRARVPR